MNEYLMSRIDKLEKKNAGLKFLCVLLTVGLIYCAKPTIERIKEDRM